MIAAVVSRSPGSEALQILRNAVERIDELRPEFDLRLADEYRVGISADPGQFAAALKMMVDRLSAGDSVIVIAGAPS